MEKGESFQNEDHQQWDDLKRARNRINSQRTRERERAQVEALEADRTRLWLSNDALKYQNHHLREAIENVQESMRKNSSEAAPPKRGQTATTAAQSKHHQLAQAAHGSQTSQLSISSLMGTAGQKTALFESAPSASPSSPSAAHLQVPVPTQMQNLQNLAGLIRNDGTASNASLGHHAGLLGLQGNPTVHRLGSGILPAMTNHRTGVSSFLLNQAASNGAGSQSLFPHGSGGDMTYNRLSNPTSDGDILSLLPGIDLRQAQRLQQSSTSSVAQGEQPHQQLLGRRSTAGSGGIDSKDFGDFGQSDDAERSRKGFKRSRHF